MDPMLQLWTRRDMMQSSDDAKDVDFFQISQGAQRYSR
jgi:hypothetical protein